MKRLDPHSYIGPIGSPTNPYRYGNNMMTCNGIPFRDSTRCKKAAEATVGHPLTIDYYSKITKAFEIAALGPDDSYGPCDDDTAGGFDNDPNGEES